MNRDSKRKPIDELREEILTGLWIDLQPHCERSAVFLVSQSLDLADVAFHIAEDSIEFVATWLEDGSLKHPSEDQIKAWNEFTAKSFRFVIVAPYVLIQEIGH